MYITISDLKGYLGITGTADDSLLYECVLRAQAAIERYTGRVFEVTTSTTRYFDAVADVMGSVLWFGTDCASITTVTNGDADSTVITSAYYVTQPRNAPPYYAIKLLASSGYAWEYSTDPENAIAISAKWGYSVTPPDDVVQACLQWASYLYRAKDAQVMDTQLLPEQGIMTVPQGIPKGVTELLKPYRRRVG